MQIPNVTGLLTVKQLSRSVLQGTTLQDIVKEQLLMIDRKILNTTKQIGGNIMLYDLPVMFTHVTSNRTDTRIMVYYYITKSLEDRGYTVKLSLGPEKSTLTVEWIIGLDDSDLADMDKYLQEKSN